MLNNQNLTQEQCDLYNKLRVAISERKDIGDILKATSVNDLSAVLTTTYTKQYEDLKHTLTLLGSAITRDSNKCVDSILTCSQHNGILQEVLGAENTLHYIEENSTYTLTSLGLAIHRDHGLYINSNRKYLNPILTKAQEGGILQDVLGAENTLHYTENDSTYTLTPLGFAIHQNSVECIDPILTKAQEGGILQDVLGAENTLNTDTVSTSELYEAINEADINSRLDNASISPTLQGNSRA